MLVGTDKGCLGLRDQVSLSTMSLFSRFELSMGSAHLISSISDNSRNFSGLGFNLGNKISGLVRYGGTLTHDLICDRYKN